MVIIETERLILRKWKDEDLEPFSCLNADARVMEYFPRVLTCEEAKAFMDRIRRHIEKYGFGLFAVEVKESREFIGYIGLAIPTIETAFTPCVEIGWRLAFDHWGKGYATEGARAVLKYGFEKMGLDEILSWTVPANVRSRKIMEKIGMRQDMEGSFRHPGLSQDHPLSLHVLYRISREGHD